MTNALYNFGEFPVTKNLSGTSFNYSREFKLVVSQGLYIAINATAHAEQRRQYPPATVNQF